MRRMYSEKQLQEQVKNQLAEGNVNDVKIFENIIDKDGHKRFVEGDIVLETIEGVTKKYGKWSLSGSHLLFVLAGDIADTTIISNNTVLSKITLPQWIFNKIALLYGLSVVSIISVACYDSGGTVQNLTIRLRKRESTVEIDAGNFTATADRTFRIAFDLLIDNE